jgi:dTDP-glucose 4,6-dehydratase
MLGILSNHYHKNSRMKNIIITGGAGFIGSHVVRLFVNKYSEYRIINVDVLTYAGNLENLSDIEDAPNYVFERVDIVDAAAVDALFDRESRGPFHQGSIGLCAHQHLGYGEFTEQLQAHSPRF